MNRKASERRKTPRKGVRITRMKDGSIFVKRAPASSARRNRDVVLHEWRSGKVTLDDIWNLLTTLPD